MQLRKTSAIIIFLGSYLPLALILAVQDLDISALHQSICSVKNILHDNCVSPFKHINLSIGFILITTLCFIVSIIVINLLPKKDSIQIIESKHIPSDLLNYVVPYILSFTTIDFDEINKLCGFAIFIIWIFWITYKSGQIGMNPVLSVFGWRLYEVKYSFKGSPNVLMGRMLSKVDILPSTTYEMGYLQDIMIAC